MPCKAKSVPYLVAMIFAHIQLLLGLVLYFAGSNGLVAFNDYLALGGSILGPLGFFWNLSCIAHGLCNNPYHYRT